MVGGGGEPSPLIIFFYVAYTAKGRAKTVVYC